MWEHRKTGKQVDKIYLMMNGEFQKKIEEAIELGRQEVINKEKP